MTHPTDNPWGYQFNQMSPQDQIESLKSYNASLLATNHEQADKIKCLVATNDALLTINAGHERAYTELESSLEAHQATITELVEALEPLIELSWVKANLPDDLPVMVAAQDAVAKAKAQIDG